MVSGPRRERCELVAAEIFEPVQRKVRRRVDPHAIDDIVSETMLTLCRRLDDVPSEAFSAWAVTAWLAGNRLMFVPLSSQCHQRCRKPSNTGHRCSPAVNRTLLSPACSNGSQGLSLVA